MSTKRKTEKSLKAEPSDAGAFQRLTDFVRRGISALLEAGAVPVRHEPNSAFEWDIQKQYGTSSEEIIDLVVAEWLKMPDDPLVLCGEGVWFARPRPG